MIIELYANAIYMLLTIMIFSLAFDLIVGEFPARIHPVVLVGGIINFFKDRLIKYNSRTAGLFLTICVIAFGSLIMLVPLLIFKMFIFNDIMEYVFKLVALLLLSSCFSVKLLLSSAREVEDDLKRGNLKVARERVSYLVSRKTSELSKEHVISATIETLTENIPDSYVSTMFYYVLFGVIAYFIGFNDFDAVIIAILAAFIHRIIDTLDSMVGYETDELINIGYVPAKLDDIVNYIPARFSGALIVVASLAMGLNWRNSYFIMRRDARAGPSPNSGYTMSAVAGALNIQLEKENVYTLGDPIHKIETECIEKAIDITRFTIFLATLFLVVILLDILLILI